MKKRSVIILVSTLILIVICVLLSTQFGVTTKRETIVLRPIYEVSPVLTNLKNWPVWFAGADKYQFQLISRNPAGISVKANNGSVQSIYSIVAYPDSVSSRTVVQWTSLVSGFDWMKQKLGLADDNPAYRLAQIERYFDDTKEFYGFEIKMGKVEDSLVLTKESMVKRTELDPGLRRLFKELQDYAEKEHLPVNIDSCRMATFYDQNKDSLRVAAGVPVTGRISSLPDGIRLLEMPDRGKMLVGKYQGPYKDLPRLYRAMRKYVFDKKLLVVGAPYEKFFSKSSSAQDSLNMIIELHFPVL